MKRVLRLGHLGTYMYGGGAERWLDSLVAQLDPQRFQFTKSLILGDEFVDPTFLSRLTMKVEVIKTRSWNPFARFFTPKKIAKFLSDCDVLLYWGPLDAKFLRQMPMPRLRIFVAHSPSAHGSFRLNPAFSNRILAVSRQSLQLMKSEVPGKVLYPVPIHKHLGASVDAREIRESLGLKVDDFVCGFVGSLMNHKRPEIILEALAALPDNFKAIFVGEGPEKLKLVARANKLKISERCRWLSTNTHIARYFSVMDALCMPSTVEGFPLVLLEAFSTGVPVICTPVGDIPQLFTSGQELLILSEKNILEEMLAAIKNVQSDSDLRLRLRENSKKFLSTLGDEKSLARNFEAILSKWYDEVQRHP